MANHQHLDLARIARETMLSEGFNPDIPADVHQQAQEINESTIISQTAVPDLRDILWSSIDNATSRDLDQIEFVEKQGENFRVLIGIADVDAFAAKGSTLDEYAAENTTSVYTGVKTFPMLPLELSTDKSSLVEGEDRLAIVIELKVALDGSVTTGEALRALVRNQAKLSYESIGKWFDNNGAVPDEVSRVPNLESQLQLQQDVARHLSEARKRHGALRLETNQATPLVDDTDRILDHQGSWPTIFPLVNPEQ